MIIPIESREHWLHLRSRNVGASEVAALFDCSPHISRYALWQIKSGRMDPPDITGERPKWGLRLEDAIADAFVEETGAHSRLRVGYVQHPTVPGMGCSPDFLITEGGVDDLPETWEDAVLETKNVDWLVKRRQWGDEPPMHILLQLQAQLACTGYGHGYVAALVGGNELVHWRFDARPKLIAEIERRVGEFWASIDAGIEPEIDGSKSTYAAIKETWRSAGDNSAIEMSDFEFAELCARLQDAKTTIKEMQAVVRECEGNIIDMMHGAQCGYGLGWRASIIEVKGKPEQVITEDMVGQTLPGRKGTLRLQVKEMMNV